MFETEMWPALYALVTSPWVWLILIASVMYAAGNYIDELLLSEYDQEVGTMVIISTLFGGIVVLAFVILSYFFDVQLLLDKPFILQGLAVGVLEALWVIPYLYATERSGAIVAGPLFEAVPVFALVMESFLGVMPPAIQIIGAFIIVAGGIIISIERDEDEDGKKTHSIDWVTLGMMSFSAILVALIYVLFRDAAVATNFIAIGFWVGLGTLLTGIFIYLVWRPYREQFNSFCKFSDNTRTISHGCNCIQCHTANFCRSYWNTFSNHWNCWHIFKESRPRNLETYFYWNTTYCNWSCRSFTWIK